MIKPILFLSMLCLSQSIWAEIDRKNTKLKNLIQWNQCSVPLVSDVTKLAIIDSGLKYGFPGRIGEGWNFYDDSSDYEDDNGHGTASAGVVYVVEPMVEILPLKVTDSAGIGTRKAVANAIIFAINAGASIINISMSLDSETLATVKNEVSIQDYQNVLIVNSAGNSGREVGLINTDKNFITVGATNLTRPIDLTIYSSWGKVDIAAPAGAPYKGITVFEDFFPTVYRTYNGTSAAAPVVAGLAARILRSYPSLNGQSLKEKVMALSKKNILPSNKIIQGRFLQWIPCETAR